jgi:hypothetical protein
MISLIIFGAGDEGEREKGAESREQRAESTKKTCDDGGEVHGSRSNLEAALQARYGRRLEACRNASHQAGWPFRSSQDKSERTVCQMPIAERMDGSELPLLCQRET